MIHVVNYEATCSICLDLQILQREPLNYRERTCTKCGMSLIEHYWGEHPHTCLRRIDGVLHSCDGWFEALDESFEE